LYVFIVIMLFVLNVQMNIRVLLIIMLNKSGIHVKQNLKHLMTDQVNKELEFLEF
jgi:hypothetical protein